MPDGSMLLRSIVSTNSPLPMPQRTEWVSILATHQTMKGVRFVAMEFVAEEGDAEELVDVLSPEGEAAGFTGGDFVEEEDEVGKEDAVGD